MIILDFVIVVLSEFIWALEWQVVAMLLIVGVDVAVGLSYLTKLHVNKSIFIEEILTAVDNLEVLDDHLDVQLVLGWTGAVIEDDMWHVLNSLLQVDRISSLLDHRLCLVAVHVCQPLAGFYPIVVADDITTREEGIISWLGPFIVAALLISYFTSGIKVLDDIVRVAKVFKSPLVLWIDKDETDMNGLLQIWFIMGEVVGKVG